MTEISMKHIKLVELLERLTDEGKQDWQMNDDDTEPVARIANFYVTIRESTSADGSGFVEIVMKNYLGEIIDSFTDDDMTVYIGNNASDNYSRMKMLFRSATRRATGADEALDEILGELSEKDDDVPF